MSMNTSMSTEWVQAKDIYKKELEHSMYRNDEAV